MYARGATAPVIKFGFTSVSYDAIDPATFAFTPPAGAKVTTKTVDGQALKAKAESMQQSHDAKGGPTTAQKQAAQQAVQGALLTRSQVAGLVPYELAWARDYTARPFQWGYVLSSAGPLMADGSPHTQGPRRARGHGPERRDRHGPRRAHHGSHSERFGAVKTSPTSVLLYGQGFGTIALAQTKTTPELEQQLKQARQASEILGSTTVNGAKALTVGTPLGGIVVWQQGDTTLIAGGMVPMSDLEAFAGSVR